jgi:hypothetical protein
LQACGEEFESFGLAIVVGVINSAGFSVVVEV